MSVVWVADAAQIPGCCGCGGGPAAAAQIQPLAWELPHATGTAVKSKKNNNDKIKKTFGLRIPCTSDLLGLPKQSTIDWEA